MLRRLQRLFARVGWRTSLEQWLLSAALRRALRGKHSDEQIGIDPLGCWVLQQTHGTAHLLSLEINDNTPFLRRLDLTRVSSVIVQTPDRYHYQFGDAELPRFYVQNAPVFHPPSGRPEQPTELVFCGTALPQFGFVYCLEFLRAYPDFSITVQGAVWPNVRKLIDRRYADLVRERRLRINEQYLSPSEMIDYLSRFFVGFCIYDLSNPEMNTFNYRTAPSGKLFSYYAAGVPVIASDIPGLQSLNDFGAGVLLRSFDPGEIKRAIESITARHREMRENCFRAARHFSFDKAIQPFRDFLLQRAAARSKTIR